MIKSIVSWLIGKNYLLTKLYYGRLFKKASFQGKDPLVVYQMGKVGSSSIVESLRLLNLNKCVYHVHSLDLETLSKLRKIYYGDDPYYWFKKYLPRSYHLFQSEYLYHQLKKRQEQKQWQIVTLVRDPVARNVSSFFQTLDLRISDFIEKYQAGMLTIAQLQQIFLEEFEEHEIPLIWLDKELKGVLGIDVYATPFPKAKGYQICRGESVEVLLIKLEMLNQCTQEAFKEFLGIENFILSQSNVADDKKYDKIYREFMQSLWLPDSYLDTMYNSKYIRHFYSNEEISRFRTKWSQSRRLLIS